MENECKKWGFRGNEELNAASAMSIRSVLYKLIDNISGNEGKRTIHLALGDPSVFPCFRTTPLAENAIVDAVRSAQFNCYPPAVGILPARRYV